MDRIAPAVLSLLLLPAIALAQDQPASSTDTATSQQATATASRDSRAVAVLGQSLVSMGAGQDSLAVGAMTFADGRTASIKVESKGPALRHEISFPDQQLVYVVNGGTGYSLKNGHKTPLPLWASQYQRPEHIPALSRLADYVQPNTQLAYLGTESVFGKPAYHVRLWSLPTDDTPPEIEALISEFHVFLDVQTLLVVKTQGYVFSPDALQNRSPVETYYSDYRAVSGVLVPFRMSRYISGHKDCDIVFTSVQLNIGIADSEFQ